MVKYGRTSLFLGILALLALSAFLSFFTGITGIFMGKNLSKSFLCLVPIMAMWISKDLVIEKIFSGFPWCLLGYSQYKHLFFIQWAEIGGIHLISAIIVLFNGMIYLYLRRREKRLLFIMLIFIMILETGGYVLIQVNRTQFADLPVHRAGIIQPNVSHDVHFDYFTAREKLEELFWQSISLKENGCEFVVWPEYSVPLYPKQDLPILQRFQEFSIQHLPVFAGFTDSHKNENVFNSIMLFARGKTSQYNKVHLTPFGEYVLFRKLLFFVKKITDEISDFTPGREVVNLELNGRFHATPICYEIIYPELVRAFMNKGAEIIITISNDSWFGNTLAPYQHLSMALFRAIENRRYLIRSTSNGVSALISPIGRIIKRSDYATQDYYPVSFQYIRKKTIFTRWGYLFPYACFAFLFLFMLREFYLKLKR